MVSSNGTSQSSTPIQANLKHFILRQTLPYVIENPMAWNGKLHIIEWSFDGRPQTDSKGQFIRIGSWTANHYFHVALGKTDKLTLRNAMYHLRGTEIGKQSKFEYVEVK